MCAKLWNIEEHRDRVKLIFNYLLVYMKLEIYFFALCLQTMCLNLCTLSRYSINEA